MFLPPLPTSGKKPTLRKHGRRCPATSGCPGNCQSSWLPGRQRRMRKTRCWRTGDSGLRDCSWRYQALTSSSVFWENIYSFKFCDVKTFPPRKSLGKDRRKTMPGERSFRRKKKRGPLQNRLLFVEYLKVQRKFDNPLLLSIKFWTIRAISNYMKYLFTVYILFNECLLKEKKRQQSNSKTSC